MSGKYLLLCKSRSRGIAVWWGPNRLGYATDVDTAGRYGEDEAKRIFLDADDVVMVPEEWLDVKVSTRRIVDLGDTNNRITIFTKPRKEPS